MDHGLHVVAEKEYTKDRYQVALKILRAGANPDPVSGCLYGIIHCILCTCILHYALVIALCWEHILEKMQSMKQATKR